MPSLQQYESGGYKYWRVVESFRDGGRPRLRVLKHIGTVDNLLAMLEGQDRELTVRSCEHGHVAALWALAGELKVAATIDDALAAHYPKGIPRRYGLTPGETCLLIALGRACHPTSKMGWSCWADKTSLPDLLKQQDISKLTSQFFWDQMDRVPVEVIPEVEQKLAAKALALHGGAVDLVLYDTTNFFTFIASTNARCKLPRRGRNKQRRLDLRQLGLALLVARDSRLPLWHQVYQGDRPDVSIFPEVLGDLRKRIVSLTSDVKDVTFVCDRGNNASRANQALLDNSNLHYVAALTPSNHRDLITRANKSFTPTDLGTGETVQVYRTKEAIWDAERTIVVYVSETLRAGQVRGIHQHLEKVTKRLTELSQRLLKPRAKKRTRRQVEEELAKVISGQYIKDILQATLTKRAPGRYHLEWSVDTAAFDELIKSRLGRGILITDRHDWTTPEILKAHRGQYEVEHVFRTLKHPQHCAVRPQYHWTDQKLHVHAFCCVLGYLLARLLHSRITQKTAFRGDLSHLLGLLREVRRSVVVQAPLSAQGHPKLRVQLDRPAGQPLDEIVEVLRLAPQSHPVASYIQPSVP